MDENKPNPALGSKKTAEAEIPDDDLPDFATPYWAERIGRVEVQKHDGWSGSGREGKA